jgi:Domain of unknown function (DUF4168)
MIDRLSLFASVCTLLTLLAPLEARAQANRLLAPSATSPSVSAAPAITPLELQQFVQAIKQVQTIEMESQKQMGELIKKGGLSLERFVEIDKAVNAGVPPSKPISEDEQKKHQAITLKIQKVWQESQPKKERAVTAQGLTVSRFGEINSQVRSDRTLQEKVKQMLGPGAS